MVNQKSKDLHSRTLLCYLFYLLETLFSHANEDNIFFVFCICFGED